MAKRKSLKDNDNDVSMRDDDDSGSDSVCAFRHKRRISFETVN